MAQQFDRLLEATVNYNFNIAKAHKFNILAGYSYQDFNNEGFSAANSQFSPIYSNTTHWLPEKQPAPR